MVFLLFLLAVLSTPLVSFSSMLPSACANGGSGSNYAYACPQMMMLSDPMIEAARLDGYDETTFIYATAGAGTDQSCGACFQVQLLDAERSWRDDFPQLIVQSINSGFDVLPHQLDLFMGGGGFGYFTACNKDCRNHYCQGGPCKEGMFDATFNQWTNAEYNDPKECYSGGVKWLDDADPVGLIRMCEQLSNFARDEKGNMTRDSCVRTNRGLFHQNFVATNSLRIQCPEHLVALTGMRRYDDGDFPVAHLGNELVDQARGDRSQGHYAITTMCDCCKPACAWENKGGVVASPMVRSCDRHGNFLSR